MLKEVGRSQGVVTADYTEASVAGFLGEGWIQHTSGVFQMGLVADMAVLDEELLELINFARIAGMIGGRLKRRDSPT
jgi:hypothetical protein